MAANRRRVWRLLHLWAGLLAGLPLLVTAVTGALLAFAQELQPYTDPAYYRVSMVGQPLAVEAVLARLEAGYPRARFNHIGVPRTADQPYVVYAAQDGEGFMLFADPYTGAITRKDNDRATVMKWVEQLHRNLLLGKPGRYLVGVASLVFVVLSVVGVYLWWPMRRGTVRKAVRSGNLLSWHNLAGLVALPVLVVIALTGATLTFHGSLIPAIYSLTAAPAKPERPTAAARSGEFIGLAAAVAAARVAAPTAQITGISAPGNADGVYSLSLRFPGERHPAGWEQLYLDPYSGEPLGRFNAYTHSFAAAYERSWWIWHTGEIFGGWGRGVWAVASGVLAGLFVTGLILWLRRRPRRRLSP